MDTQVDEEVDAPIDLEEGCAFCGETVSTDGDGGFRCGSCLARYTGAPGHAYPLWGPFGSTERVSDDAVATAFVDDQRDGQWISGGKGFFDDDMR